MKRLVLATAVAIACSGAFAAHNEWQESCKPGASCELINFTFSTHAAKEFREAEITEDFSILLPDGEVAEFCPDIKGRGWPLKNGLAVPFGKDGTVVGQAFRVDGVTPITPTSCMTVVGTGERRLVTVLWQLSIPGGYVGEFKADVIPGLVRAE